MAKIEVGDIFREFGPAYRRMYKLPLRYVKAMRAIENCRTAELGGHVEECDRCGHIRIAYNSCRNRHCPKCQSLPREKWLAARRRDVLPVEYFHIIFTIPDILNALTVRYQKVMYDILFKASSESLLELSKDAKYTGSEIGFIALLHTWGQNLMDHPHLHCVVPGGGLSVDGTRWISSREGFFIPVKVLSGLFKGKFLWYLKKAYQSGRLNCVGVVQLLGEEEEFGKMLDDLYQREWVVYCKPPFRGPHQVIEYLGRYTHRVAITNNRIVKVEEGKVTFRWRDYKDHNRTKFMTVDAFEFIRRFLLHILPDNFVKIRHYGLMSNRNRKTKFRRCQEILGVDSNWEQESSESESWEELLYKLTGIDPRICPCCGRGRMVAIEVLQPQSHSPPGK